MRVVEGDIDLALLGTLRGIRTMGFQVAVVFVLRGNHRPQLRLRSLVARQTKKAQSIALCAFSEN